MHPSATFVFTRKKRESDKAYSFIQRMGFVLRRRCIYYVVPNFRSKTVGIFDFTLLNTSEAKRSSNSGHPDLHLDRYEMPHLTRKCA